MRPQPRPRLENPILLAHLTPTGAWRNRILRLYRDEQEHPSVECPVGDFFANGWGHYARVNSLAVCVNPGGAFNCCWPMPFRKRYRITYENRGEERSTLYFRINYELNECPRTPPISMHGSKG